MLIVSKFHDYYDVGMKSGVDKTCVYKRDTDVIKGGFAKPTVGSTTGFWSHGVIGFCGKFYPFVCYFNVQREMTQIVWDVEDAILAIKPKHNNYMSWREYDLDSETGIKKFFSYNFQPFEELFHTHKTPIFGFTPSARTHWGRWEPYVSLTVNPPLKPLKFFKVKDPITAFQEISMFLSGVIGMPEKPTIEISDKVKAASKGHDGEYSFKKQPGKRGKNKWR